VTTYEIVPAPDDEDRAVIVAALEQLADEGEDEAPSAWSRRARHEIVDDGIA
jgi:hypothetical protein